MVRRERLIAARKATGQSQMGLSTAAGISRASLARYEANEVEPSVSTALAIAKALRTTVEVLFKANPPRKRPGAVTAARGMTTSEDTDAVPQT